MSIYKTSKVGIEVDQHLINTDGSADKNNYCNDNHILL